MNARRLSVLILACAVLLALATAVIVIAQSGGGRPYAEGQAPGVAQGSSAAGYQAAKKVEGKDPNAVVGSGELDAVQGEGSRVEQQAASTLPLLYQFSGVRDDGAKAASGKAATTLICSNTGTTLAAVSYYVYNYSGSVYYYTDFNLAAGATITASTQLTNLYYEDIALHATGTTDNGTGVIDQGRGQVFSNSHSVICTAQVLDPTGFPPAFTAELELFR
jgi:hypothetical protein